MKLNKSGVIATGGLVVVVGVVGWLIWNARKPLSKRSEDAVSAMLSGNAAALMKYATDREIKEDGLTRDRLQQVLDQLVLPNVDKSKEPEYASNDSSRGINGVAEVTIFRKDGTPTPVPFEIWKTDDGPKTGVLGLVLLDADILRYGHPEGAGYPRNEQTRVMLEGLKHDRPFLTGLGLTGLTPTDPLRKTRNWDELEKSWVDTLAKEGIGGKTSRGPFRIAGGQAPVGPP